MPAAESMMRAAVQWLATRYDDGRPSFTGGQLHTFLSNLANFRRLPQNQEEANELSVLAGRFVAVLNRLVDLGYATIDQPPCEQPSRKPSFRMKFRATEKVLRDATPGGAESDAQAVRWSRPRPPAEWAVVFDCSTRSIRRMFPEDDERVDRLTRSKVKILLSALPDHYDDSQSRYAQRTRSGQRKT